MRSLRTASLQILLEETMDAVSSLWNVATGSTSITKMVKLLLTTPLPNTTAKMLASGGHVLRISDNRPFDTYEHKMLLRALADTWNTGRSAVPYLWVLI